MKKFLTLSACFCLLCCLSFQTRAQSSSVQELYSQTSETADIMINYRQDIAAINRFYTPYLEEGPRRRWDSQVQPSPEQLKRLAEVNRQYLERINQKEFKSISVYGKVDAILLKRDIQTSLQQVAAQEKEYAQISQYIPFAEVIYQLEKARRRGASIDGQQIAASYTTLISDIDAATAKLEQQPPLDMKLALRLKESIEGLNYRLKSVFKFYEGYDPSFTWWVTEPHKTLTSKLDAYAQTALKKGKVKTTQKPDNSGITGVPIGRDEMISQLKAEMIDYTPEELLDIANKEFAWCDREMLKASKEMGFGTDWKKALEKVKNSYVPVGKQPEMILGLYNRSVDFVKSHNMVTIPPLAEETWGMIMMTPERQLVNPFFTGGREISISYPTSSMAQKDKLMSMRGNNPYFSLGTVQHELLPGHNLQFFMNSRSKAYREDFSTPFWTEGWSLYWEMLLYDNGFAVTPEERVGMLFWRMHRCARILFSINYHLGKWTPQECIDFLVDRVGHERANAEGEVRRSFTGGYSPLYQVAYLIGGLQFYALERELVESGKMTLRQYHDKVMQENNIPVEMLRATLTNQNLNLDYQTGWRFYRERPVTAGSGK